MKEISEIYQEMKDALERSSGVCVNDGGDMALRLGAVAAQLASLWAQIDWTVRQCFPQSAAGVCLERHAEARGLQRGGSSAAEGSIRFETDTARSEALLVPSGTVCMNAAGTEFVTTLDGAINAGEQYCDVRARAREAGGYGNVPAESIVFMARAPVGIVRCFNPAAFSGGADVEDDEALRGRVLASYASLPNGSNKAYYTSVAMNTDGVSSASVIPRARGIGTVDVYISGGGGLPSAELIDRVAAKLEEQREICVDVRVLSPTGVTVPVSVAISVAEGYDYDTVAADVSERLGAFFGGERLGRNVLRAELGYVVFGVPGVENYNITLPAADVEIDDDELPVAGSITVSEAV